MNIGLIVSCTPDFLTGDCYASIRTVEPLAASLGLDIDTSCGLDDDSDEECLPTLLENFALSSSRAILISWDLGLMEELYEMLGVEIDMGEEDGGTGTHNDIIVTIRNELFIGQTSQNCAGIDGIEPGTEYRVASKRSLSSERRKQRRVKQRRRRINSRIEGST